MPVGLIGKKCGMTRVFTDAGESVPVTVIEVQPNRITRLKTLESDGYRAIQVTRGSRKAQRVSKTEAGEFRKAGVEAGTGLWEFRLGDSEALPTVEEAAAATEATDGEEAEAPAAEKRDAKVGDALGVKLFEEGQMVDVSGTTIGKGFAGTIKRHNFSSQRMTHGNSLSHRAPGSIGQNQTPGRVFKGKKMAGQMGNVRRTVQNLRIVGVDVERNLLLVRGGVPGSKGTDLIVHPAEKARGKSGN